MNIRDFVKKFRNHPVLFVGTGISLRYLNNSYTWDDLLRKIANDVSDSEEVYLDIKSKSQKNDVYQYEVIASKVQVIFDKYLENNRNGKFKDINDQFYEFMKNDINIPRIKLYISALLSNLDYKKNKIDELELFKKISKNISSVITTNYDRLIDEVLGFSPLIGNGILLSNPYGSVYKIHGCVEQPSKIIITEKDYENFNVKYELIQAQLISLFAHNPIIFLGYSVSDKNIKTILKTIFKYVEPNSELAEQIRGNFLLVEYEPDSDNEEITDHDIDLAEFDNTIRINRLKTDNYTALFNSLSELELPVSTMDIRKVQNVMKELLTGGTVKVSIAGDLDELENGEKILTIGKTYYHQTPKGILSSYFNLLEQKTVGAIICIDEFVINDNNYFPIYGFCEICTTLKKEAVLKTQQEQLINKLYQKIPDRRKLNEPVTIAQILNNKAIPESYKYQAIIYGVLNGYIQLDDVEGYLRSIDKIDTKYRQILCAYDIKKYSNVWEL